MKKPKTPIKENDLQSSILAAMQDFASRNNITVQSSWRYANQQGEGLRKLCADFVTTLDSSAIFLAEVKVQHGGELIEFKQHQYEENCSFEEAGYPIHYVYNATNKHPYFDSPQLVGWAVSTLAQTNYASPSKLPGSTPCIDSHPNLLSWMSRTTKGDSTELLAQIFARIRANQINNGLLMLIYGVRHLDVLVDLNPDALTMLVDALADGGPKYLRKKDQELLKRFLDREEALFSRWAAPKQSQTQSSDFDPEPSPDDTGGAGTSPKKHRSTSRFGF